MVYDQHLTHLLNMNTV